MKPPEMFRSEIGSHAMDLSMENPRANLENTDFQGAGDTVRSGSSVTPRSPGNLNTSFYWVKWMGSPKLFQCCNLVPVRIFSA